MCSFVIDKFETCRKKACVWVSEWEPQLLLSLHTLTDCPWFATYVLLYFLSLSLSHFFNENEENASKINIILPLYVSASDLLFIAKIFCWLVAHLYIWSICLNLSEWELIRYETKPNLIKIQQIYQSHYLIELQ